jgi:hypothetical protein
MPPTDQENLSYTSRLLLLVLLSSTIQQAAATQAIQLPFTATQYGGNQITLVVRGNEFINYLSDEDGFPVVEKAATSTPYADQPLLASMEALQYVYGTVDQSGALQPTSFLVGESDPHQIPEMLAIGPKRVNDRLLAAMAANGETLSSESAPHNPPGIASKLRLSSYLMCT